MPVLLNILAILPGLLICLYIYRLDKYERESKVQLIICFLLGMLVTLPIFYLQKWTDNPGVYFSSQIWKLLLSSFIIVGLGEELVKFIALYAYPFQRPFFNEPFDGIIYAVMISMGFATLENVLYANRYGIETTVLRAFTAVPAHAVFGVIVGYFAGLAKFDTARRWSILLKGLGIAALIHGLYDFFILQEYLEWLIVLAVIVLWLSLWYASRLIKLHQVNSPFREAESPQLEDLPPLEEESGEDSTGLDGLNV